MSSRSQPATDIGPPGPGPTAYGNRFYRFLRFSHILSSTLREILEQKYLSEVSTQKLTPTQFGFLKLIALNPDLQVGEVAKFLGVSSAAGTKTIDKLEGYGLVARGGSPGDRRATLLSASNKGRRLVKEYEQLKAARMAPVVGEIGDDKIDQLCDLLEQVCISLLEQEKPLEGSCLRCAGYYQADCSLEPIQGGCALRERRGTRSQDVRFSNADATQTRSDTETS